MSGVHRLSSGQQRTDGFIIGRLSDRSDLRGNWKTPNVNSLLTGKPQWSEWAGRTSPCDILAQTLHFLGIWRLKWNADRNSDYRVRRSGDCITPRRLHLNITRWEAENSLTSRRIWRNTGCSIFYWRGENILNVQVWDISVIYFSLTWYLWLMKWDSNKNANHVLNIRFSRGSGGDTAG